MVHWWSARECVAAMERREVSSLELVDACVKRIEKLNPRLNAVVATDFERAREAARDADDARMHADSLGPLHGVPITVKDAFQTAGLVTTSGAPEYRNFVPTEDAVAVERALHAGAIVLGKTNLPIYAGDFQTYNEVYGRTNNPWDVTRTVGGSSGGAAAAIAAGLVPLEIGSDIAGSIRGPAHYCGVYGHKSSYGLVPNRGHIPGPPGTKAEPDLGVVGPLARTPEDLRLLLEVLAGPDELDAPGWKLELPPARAERLEGFRVGVWMDDPLCPIDSAVRTQLEQTIEALRPHVLLVEPRLQFTLEDVVAPYMSLLLGIVGPGLPGSLKALARVLLPRYALTDRLGLPSDVVTKGATRGLVQSHAQWAAANERRVKLRWACQSLFRDIDVLLCPVTPVAAFTHRTNGNQFTRSIKVNGRDRPYIDHIPWAALATVASLPSTSAPVGRTSEGLPVNIQIVGPYLGDKTTLRFAELLREVRGGFEAPPV